MTFSLYLPLKDSSVASIETIFGTGLLSRPIKFEAIPKSALRVGSKPKIIELFG